MKLPKFFHRGKCTLLLFGLGAAMLCGAGYLRSQDESPGSDWPRSYSVDDDDVIIYQPKVEKWDQKYIEARFAVGIKGKNDEHPIYGSFLARGETLANIEARTVSIFNITEDDFIFPDAGTRLEHFKRDLAAVAPDKPLTVPMDQLVASVPSEDTVTQDTVVTDTDSNAPRVVVSYTPTLLVAFDGEPVFHPIPGSNFESAVNTAATVLRPAGQKAPLFVLSNEGQWLTADDLEGPWEGCPAPEGIKKIPSTHPVALAIKNAATSGDPDEADVPDVITTNKPTELIQIKGKPSYKQIGDSALVRLGNTDTPLFYHFDQSLFYMLASGRWFESKDLKGPWTYVAQNALPQEFAQIPEDDPSAEVLASVSGTPQAEEAVVESQIPRKVRVSLKNPPQLEVQYDGEPKFVKIEGTDMAYAVNTTSEVLLVGSRYYCCDDGIWFVSDRAVDAEWRLVTVLPRAILSLPPSCPLYHVRFCTVDSFTDDYVVYACTDGYWGTYIDPDTHVAVYGTGHFYTPYVSSSYYVGYFWTYGYGYRWWRHHGFVLAARHVAHTAWLSQSIQKGPHSKVWRPGMERMSGHMEKGIWHPMVHSSTPFHSWGDKVAVHHLDLMDSTTHPTQGNSKPHVVFHGKPSPKHLVVFEKSLHAGSHGEILRQNGKTWEHREQGKWVVHSGDPKVERHGPVMAHAQIDQSQKSLSQGKKNFAIRPADSANLDKKFVMQRQDSVKGDKQILGEKKIIVEKHYVERLPDPEHKIIRSDDIPRGRSGTVLAKGDNPPTEHRIIKGDTEVVTGRIIERHAPPPKGVISSSDMPKEHVYIAPRGDSAPTEHHISRRDVQTQTETVRQPTYTPQVQQVQPSFQPRTEVHVVTPTPVEHRELRVEHHDSGGGSNVPANVVRSSGSGNSGPTNAVHGSNGSGSSSGSTTRSGGNSGNGSRSNNNKNGNGNN